MWTKTKNCKEKLKQETAHEKNRKHVMTDDDDEDDKKSLIFTLCEKSLSATISTNATKTVNHLLLKCQCKTLFVVTINRNQIVI